MPEKEKSVPRQLTDDEDVLDITPGYPLADEVMKEDWDDTNVAEYDRYEEYKQ